MNKKNQDNIEDINLNKNLSIVDAKNLDKNRNSDSFQLYLKEIQKFPILTAEEEFNYAKRFKENGDKEAAKMLVQSHLRLVAKIAIKFKNYGLPISDLVSEGNLGLIQAVKKFDPDKGFRFSTYAMWWVKAYIQEYILKSWSLVKIGTTIAQKKLFFNLHKIKRRIKNNDDKNLSEEQIERISDDLNVSKKEVKEMESRLSGSDISIDSSLDDDEDSLNIKNSLASHEANQEQIIIENQEKNHREYVLREAFAVLNDREKDILIKRQMSEISMTLEELSKIYKISRERIRQIEQNALDKMKKEIIRLQNRKL